MKRLVLVMALLLVCSASTLAQTAGKRTYPKWEFFAGYNLELVKNDTCRMYLPTASGGRICVVQMSQVITNDTDLLKPHIAMNGFQVAAIRNFNNYLGVRADFSGYFKKVFLVQQDARGTSQTQVNSRVYQYMVGPEIKLRSDSLISPFGYALMGSAHSAVNQTTVGTTSQFHPGASFEDNDGLATSVGGGVDLRVSERASLRYSIDYNPARNPSFFQTQNNVRTSVGILFH